MREPARVRLSRSGSASTATVPLSMRFSSHENKARAICATIRSSMQVSVPPSHSPQGGTDRGLAHPQPFRRLRLAETRSQEYRYPVLCGTERPSVLPVGVERGVSSRQPVREWDELPALAPAPFPPVGVDDVEVHPPAAPLIAEHPVHREVVSLPTVDDSSTKTTKSQLRRTEANLVPPDRVRFSAFTHPAPSSHPWRR
jgi:hypothetical protein